MIDLRTRLHSHTRTDRIGEEDNRLVTVSRVAVCYIGAGKFRRGGG